MKAPEPVSQHQWLQRMVGEWVWESEYEPGKKMTGTESVRPLGSLWVICHGRGEMPEGGGHQSIMTLGNDPRKERFVGTFVGSVMNNLWIYSGVLEGNALTLDTEGPSFTPEANIIPYKDRIELLTDDERTLTSRLHTESGEWQEIMKDVPQGAIVSGRSLERAFKSPG